MTKKIIALYDSNEDFICRLCSGFQQNCTLSLEFLPFTSLEKLLAFHSDHSISMLLATEAMLTPQLISLFSETLILLSDENLSYKKNLPCLFKYQPCSQLFQDFMRLCSNQLFLTMEHSTSSATQNLTLIESSSLTLIALFISFECYLNTVQASICFTLCTPFFTLLRSKSYCSASFTTSAIFLRSVSPFATQIA